MESALRDLKVPKSSDVPRRQISRKICDEFSMRLSHFPNNIYGACIIISPFRKEDFYKNIEKYIESRLEARRWHYRFGNNFKKRFGKSLLMHRHVDDRGIFANILTRFAFLMSRAIKKLCVCVFGGALELGRREILHLDIRTDKSSVRRVELEFFKSFISGFFWLLNTL